MNFFKDTQVASKHMRQCSIPLVIGQIQIRTTSRYCFMPCRMAATKRKRENRRSADVEKVEPWYTARGNVKGGPCVQNYLVIPQKVNPELLQGPIIPLPGIDPNCTPMSTAKASVVAESRQHPRRPPCTNAQAGRGERTLCDMISHEGE